MLYIEKDAVEMARKTAQARLAEYEAAVEHGTAEDRLAALAAWKEANGAWLTMVRNGFHL